VNLLFKLKECNVIIIIMSSWFISLTSNWLEFITSVGRIFTFLFIYLFFVGLEGRVMRSMNANVNKVLNKGTDGLT